MDWWNLMKQSVTVGAQLLWGGRYGCNNGRYGCTIVMSYIEISKAVSKWLLIFNPCVSVAWPLTCVVHILCTHTPEIIDMHRGMYDNYWAETGWSSLIGFESRTGTYLLLDSHLLDILGIVNDHVINLLFSGCREWNHPVIILLFAGC